jgi:hypothetical protein
MSKSGWQEVSELLLNFSSETGVLDNSFIKVNNTTKELQKGEDGLFKKYSSYLSKANPHASFIAINDNPSDPYDTVNSGKSGD